MTRLIKWPTIAHNLYGRRWRCCHGLANSGFLKIIALELIVIIKNKYFRHSVIHMDLKHIQMFSVNTLMNFKSQKIHPSSTIFQCADLAVVNFALSIRTCHFKKTL